VRFGFGNDVFDVADGSVAGAVQFGAGNNTMACLATRFIPVPWSSARETTLSTLPAPRASAAWSISAAVPTLWRSQAVRCSRVAWSTPVTCP